MISTKPKADTDEWRKKNICHTCRDKDECPDGKRRDWEYGAIVVNCTGHKEE